METEGIKGKNQNLSLNSVVFLALSPIISFNINARLWQKFIFFVPPRALFLSTIMG